MKRWGVCPVACDGRGSVSLWHFMLKLRFGLCLLATMVAAGSGGWFDAEGGGSFVGSTDVGAAKT
jgi:hypothetical protein